MEHLWTWFIGLTSGWQFTFIIIILLSIGWLMDWIIKLIREFKK